METLNNMKIDHSPEKVENNEDSKARPADDVEADVIKNYKNN